MLQVVRHILSSGLWTYFGLGDVKVLVGLVGLVGEKGLVGLGLDWQ